MGRPRGRASSDRARSPTFRATSCTAPTTPATTTLVFLAILSPAMFEGPALVDVSGEEPWASLRPARARTLTADGAHRRSWPARSTPKARSTPSCATACAARGVDVLVMDLGILGEPAFAAGHPGRRGRPRRRRRSGGAAGARRSRRGGRRHAARRVRARARRSTRRAASTACSASAAAAARR